MTFIEETLALLRHADDTLRHARINRREGLYRTAISLAYYAAFYAAQAVTAINREGPKTHHGVMTRFSLLAVKESDFPPEVSGLLPQLEEHRLAADYDHATWDNWTESDASRVIRQAGRFVNEVHDWFDRHHRAELQGVTAQPPELERLTPSTGGHRHS